MQSYILEKFIQICARLRLNAVEWKKKVGGLATPHPPPHPPVLGPFWAPPGGGPGPVLDPVFEVVLGPVFLIIFDFNK